MQELKLYSYFRSSAAYRVRIALALKGLSYELVPIDLLHGGGEQHSPEYRSLNPAALIPALQDGADLISQSLAIIEYIDELHAPASLLPGDALARARIRALSLAIACDIHPLNNLRVLRYMSRDLQLDQNQRDTWYRHWISLGFDALEQNLQAAATGKFCHGDTPTMADCCLIPQALNARRLQLDLKTWPTIWRITQECEALAAFATAHPDAQPDHRP